MKLYQHIIAPILNDWKTPLPVTAASKRTRRFSYQPVAVDSSALEDSVDDASQASPPQRSALIHPRYSLEPCLHGSRHFLTLGISKGGAL